MSSVFFFFFIGELLSGALPYSRLDAFLQTVWTPKFKDWRSSPIDLSQVVLGRPTGLLQSAGGLSAAAIIVIKDKWHGDGPPRER